MQPFASVAVTVYVPADKPLFVAPTVPFDHRYVYPAVPPTAATVVEPSLPKLQLTGVLDEIFTCNNAGAVTVPLAEAVHPLPSVIVTV